MKNLIRIILMGGLVAAMTNAAIAQQDIPDIHRGKSRNTAIATSKASARFYGMIVSLDIIANTIEVKNKKTSRTFSADAHTEIQISGQPARLGDLKKESSVEIRYKNIDGKKLASRIKQ
jgi:hypothetical protein